MIALARERCEVVIIDTPPGLGAIPRRVLELSQHAIIPLQCEPLALQTTPQMLRGIQEIAATQRGAHARRHRAHDVRPCKPRLPARERISARESAARHGVRHRHSAQRGGVRGVRRGTAGGAARSRGSGIAGVREPRDGARGAVRSERARARNDLERWRAALLLVRRGHFVRRERRPARTMPLSIQFTPPAAAVDARGASSCTTRSATSTRCTRSCSTRPATRFRARRFATCTRTRRTS